jgi:hypothetical protein
MLTWGEMEFMIITSFGLQLVRAIIQAVFMRISLKTSRDLSIWEMTVKGLLGFCGNS